MLAASLQGSERRRGGRFVNSGAEAQDSHPVEFRSRGRPAPHSPCPGARGICGSGYATCTPGRARHPQSAVRKWLVTAALSSILTVALALAPVDPTRGQDLQDGLSVAYGNPPAPPLTLEDIDGRVHRLSDSRGKVIVVNFWATWCPPCVAEMPAIQRMYDALGDEGVRVLAVNAGESAQDIRSFVKDFEPALTFPLLRDPKGDTFEQWRVLGLPHTFIVDRSGRLAYTAAGARQMDSPHIMERLRALLE